MSLKEHHLTRHNECLKKALQEAIDYLKQMPRSPITQAKIAQLEKKQNLPLGEYELELPASWKMERFTPGGQSLRITVENGEIRFETGIPLESGSRVPFGLEVKDIDAIIAALASQRQDLKSSSTQNADISKEN